MQYAVQVIPFIRYDGFNQEEIKNFASRSMNTPLEDINTSIDSGTQALTLTHPAPDSSTWTFVIELGHAFIGGGILSPESFLQAYRIVA